jgi:hypothetical protein
MNKLIVMSFDGDYRTEDNRGDNFKSVDNAWEFDNNMGSRWYFYPFHFVTTASGKTIADAPQFLKWTIGKRVKTIARLFEAASKLPENAMADCDSFIFSLTEGVECE